MTSNRTIQNHSESRYVRTYTGGQRREGGGAVSPALASLASPEMKCRSLLQTWLSASLCPCSKWDHSWKCSKRQRMWLEGSTLVYKELHTWQTLVKFNLSLTFHLINRLTPILYRVAFLHLPPPTYSLPPQYSPPAPLPSPSPSPHSSIPEMEGGSVRYSHSGGGSRGTSGSTTRPGGATPATGGALLEACCCCCCCYWRQ